MEHYDFVKVSPRPLWWAGAPALYPQFKAQMLKAYPDAHACIDSLLPVGFASADIGIGGAMTTLESITDAMLANVQHWQRRARQWSRLTSSLPVHRTLYDTALRDGAELLFKAWDQSHALRGWMAVEIEPSETHSAQRMFKRARELANLMPNIMVSVPLNEMGCEVIEELVATGHAINASHCFSVAQVQACLSAIARGRQRALAKRVNLGRTRHLISVKSALFDAPSEFVVQAARLGMDFSSSEHRWAEMALHHALCAALQGQDDSVSLMFGGIGPTVECPTHCSWPAAEHQDVLRSIDQGQFEQLIAGARHGTCGGEQRIGEIPDAVMARLLRIGCFRQAVGVDELASADFARHPFFTYCIGRSLHSYTRLLSFARQLNPPLYAGEFYAGEVSRIAGQNT